MYEEKLSHLRKILYDSINDLIVAGKPIIQNGSYNWTIRKKLKHFLSEYGESFYQNKLRLLKAEEKKKAKEELRNKIKPQQTEEKGGWKTYL